MQGDYHVIVPAYQEASNIADLHVLEDMLEERALDYSISVVDDGSEDGTYAELQELAENSRNIRPLGYPENHGKGYALREGFRKIEGEPDYVVFFDADGDIRPESLIDILELAEETGEDIIVASKWHEDSRTEYPRTRTVLSKIFGVFTRIYLGLGPADTQTGLKAVRYEVLDELIEDLEIDGYAFDTELLYLARKQSYGILEAPVKLEYGDGSFLGLREMFRIMEDSLRLRFR